MEEQKGVSPGKEASTIDKKSLTSLHKLTILFVKSLGAMSTTVAFLTQHEVLGLHSLNRWWYDRGVERI